jgi:hypothetical protein
MHSRASQALTVAFRTRGAQTQLSARTGISQTRLSRLAGGDTEPNLDNSLKLKDDPEVPIDPSWWRLPPLPDESLAPVAASGTEG